MKHIYVVLVFLQKNDFTLIVHKKNHTQPCFDMQLIELMPFFKGYSQGVILPFFQRL